MWEILDPISILKRDGHQQMKASHEANNNKVDRKNVVKYYE